MKKYLLSIVLIATVGTVFAQVPATKPIVKGIVWLGQSTPPVSPGLYEQYKDSDDGITYEWDGDSWEPFGAAAADGNDFPTGLNLTGTLLTLTVPNQPDPSVDLASLQDGDNQELGITANVLTIENGTIGIDLSTYLDGPASSLANSDQLIPAGTTREVQMGDATSEILIQNSAGNASILALDDGGAFFGISARVPDLAYGPTWDGAINVPTRNAIYDKFQSLTGIDVAYENGTSGAASTNVQDLGDELWARGVNLGYTASATDGIVTNDRGTNSTIPLANDTNAGLLSPAEHAIVNRAVQSDITGLPGADPVGNVVSGTKEEIESWPTDDERVSVCTNCKTPDIAQGMLSDMTTNITTGTNKGYWRAPVSGEITHLNIYVQTPGTSTGITVDLNKNGSTIASTKITTDAAQKDSDDATTPYVLTSTTFVEGDEFTWDIDGVPTGGKAVQWTIKYEY